MMTFPRPPDGLLQDRLPVGVVEALGLLQAVGLPNAGRYKSL